MGEIKFLTADEAIANSTMMMKNLLKQSIEYYDLRKGEEWIDEVNSFSYDIKSNINKAKSISEKTGYGMMIADIKECVAEILPESAGTIKPNTIIYFLTFVNEQKMLIADILGSYFAPKHIAENKYSIQTTKGVATIRLITEALTMLGKKITESHISEVFDSVNGNELLKAELISFENNATEM